MYPHPSQPLQQPIVAVHLLLCGVYVFASGIVWAANGTRYVEENWLDFVILGCIAIGLVPLVAASVSAVVYLTEYAGRERDHVVFLMIAMALFWTAATYLEAAK